MDSGNLSSNWKNLQAQLRTSASASQFPENKPSKRKRSAIDQAKSSTSTTNKRPRRHGSLNQGTAGAAHSRSKMIMAATGNDTSASREHPSIDRVNVGLCSGVEMGKYIAMDCEMVGIGPDPRNESALARVSLVNYDGHQVYDSYVRPLEQVTDWRTHVSGIQPKHMLHARTLEQVQKDVGAILQDRILVGHAVRHDLDALMLGHPRRDIRDTVKHPPYRQIAGGSSPKLQILASHFLGLEIQVGEHSSLEDARACMMLFRRDKAAFEQEHAKRWPAVHVKQTLDESIESSKPHKPSKAKKKKRKKR